MSNRPSQNSPNFPAWQVRLHNSGLVSPIINAYEITIRWYLFYCTETALDLSVSSARLFIAAAKREKKPEDWQIKQWKDAINWYFIERKGIPDWYNKTKRLLQVRHYAYKTEKSYLRWISRYRDFSETEDLHRLGVKGITPFLE